MWPLRHADSGFKVQLTCPRSHKLGGGVWPGEGVLCSDLKPKAPILKQAASLGDSPARLPKYQNPFEEDSSGISIRDSGNSQPELHLSFFLEFVSSGLPGLTREPIPNKPKIVKTPDQRQVLHESMSAGDRGGKLFFFPKVILTPWFPKDFKNNGLDY